MTKQRHQAIKAAWRDVKAQTAWLEFAAVNTYRNGLDYPLWGLLTWGQKDDIKRIVNRATRQHKSRFEALSTWAAVAFPFHNQPNQ